MKQEHAEVKTESLLRPVTEADTERILRWRNDEGVRRRFVYRELLTRERHEEWLKNEVETGRCVQWIICDREENGRPVGTVYLRDVDRDRESAEFGILIGEEDARGKGIALRATREALAYGFEVLHLKTVGLRVYTGNLPAIRLYERAGFQTKRLLPDVISSDGEREDMYWMEAQAPTAKTPPGML